MPSFHVSRSIEISAPPEQVFETVADFGSWTTWSPWLGADPNADVTVTDPANEVGSIYKWSGEVVGAGEIEHRRLEPGQLIDEEIRFVKPFKSTSDVAFEIEPTLDGSRVTWHMRGSLPWFLFWMKGQMEVFIGMDYERGLKMLKELVETGGVASKMDNLGVNAVGPLNVVGVRRSCGVAEIGPIMKAAIDEAGSKLWENECPSEDCQVVTVYHKFDLKAQTFDFTSGFSVAQVPDPLPTGLSSWVMPQKEGLRVEHLGRYEHLGNAWSAANQIARYKKLKLAKDCGYEIYLNDPKTTPPTELKTEIVLPLK